MAYKPITENDLEDDLALEIEAEENKQLNEKTALLSDKKVCWATLILPRGIQFPIFVRSSPIIFKNARPMG